MSIDHSGGPLADEKTSLALTHKSYESAGRGGRLGTEIGQLINDAAAVGGAMGPDRTGRARGLFRSANERAQFHEGLVEVGTRQWLMCG